VPSFCFIPFHPHVDNCSQFTHHRVPYSLSMSLILFASTGLFVIILWYSLRRKKDLPLPPGPLPLPIIGNGHQTPSINACRTYQKWHKTYGPIVALRYGRKDVISIGSHQVARDLLEKKSSIYSSRPQFIIASQCIAKNLHTALLPYGP
jgi:hypothetical protein